MSRTALAFDRRDFSWTPGGYGALSLFCASS
jgi:hypothetical protein